MACQGYGAVFLYTLIKKQWKPSPTSSIVKSPQPTIKQARHPHCLWKEYHWAAFLASSFIMLMLLHVSSVYTFTIYFTWRILLCTKKFLIKLDLLRINGISRIPRFMHTIPMLLIFWTLMPVDASRSIIARSRIPSHSSRISSKSSSEYVSFTVLQV